MGGDNTDFGSDGISHGEQNEMKILQFFKTIYGRPLLKLLSKMIYLFKAIVSY